MHTIPILDIDFSDGISGWQIPAFRAAVVEQLGRERDLLHNHLPGKNRFHNRYPLVQYKRKGGRASMLCLGDAVAEGQALLGERPQPVTLRDGTRLQMRVYQMRQRQFTLAFTEEMQAYRLRNWLALNQENYRRYLQLEDLGQKAAFLQEKLRNHLVALCFGLGFRPDQEIRVSLDELEPIRWVKLKGLSVAGFNVRFRCNLRLPEGIGIGKASSRGYGVVRARFARG